MTKRKAKKQEEVPEEPTTFDRISAATDRVFGVREPSVTQQVLDKLYDHITSETEPAEGGEIGAPDVPQLFPERKDLDPEGFEDDDAPDDRQDVSVVANEGAETE